MFYFNKKKMKIRKRAVQALQSSRGITLKQATSMEEKIWTIAPKAHQRIIRMLIMEKKKNITDINMLTSTK